MKLMGRRRARERDKYRGKRVKSDSGTVKGSHGARKDQEKGDT
jgi:hypothetical protein